MQMTDNILKTLIACDSIGLVYDREKSESTIEMIVRKHIGGRLDGAEEVRFDVPVVIRNFGGTPVNFISTSLIFVQDDRNAMTAIRNAKQGDIFTIVVYAGNNNQHLKDAGLYHDMLHFVFTQAGKNNQYMVRDSIAPNGVSRMCREFPILTER